MNVADDARIGVPAFAVAAFVALRPRSRQGASVKLARFR